MDPLELLDEYLTGPAVLRDAVTSLSPEQLDDVPVPGKWSVRQVVCHLADAELIYAERIKRVLAEDNPTIAEWSPDLSVLPEFCQQRDPQNEMELIECIRRHIHGLLHTLDIEVWQRTAVHTTDGPMTLETLLERITAHIPHHVEFIEQKKAALELL